MNDLLEPTLPDPWLPRNEYIKKAITLDCAKLADDQKLPVFVRELSYNVWKNAYVLPVHFFNALTNDNLDKLIDYIMEHNEVIHTQGKKYSFATWVVTLTALILAKGEGESYHTVEVVRESLDGLTMLCMKEKAYRNGDCSVTPKDRLQYSVLGNECNPGKYNPLI